MPLEFIVAAVTVLVAGVAYGLTGFGFALVVVPPLLAIYPPETVVTIGILLSTLTGWIVLPGAWREIQFPAVLTLTPSAIGGVVLGVLLLRALDPDRIKILASFVVIAFSIWLLRGWALPGARTRLAAGMAGVTSGVMTTMGGMNGPPIVMLFVARGYDVHAFRASIIMVFLLIDLVALAILGWTGTIGWTEVRTALILLPFAITGTVCGRLLVTRVAGEVFRRLVLVMVLITGLVGLALALRPLLDAAV